MSKNDNLAVNTIRLLCADMVQKANSGHPGLPMGSAPMAYDVWKNVMKHNPKNSKWANRDRFVLSSGHASTLLYSLLHLFDYGLEISDLENFRKFGSKTPGHPEYGHTVGVEFTTGPLGQGFAGAVGMAWAESRLAAEFNKKDFEIVDHCTYVLCGDGCVMEGINHESASLAGTLGLGKLIVLYDSNNITIEGSTDLAFTEDVLKRFEAYNWHIQKVQDGNDIKAIHKALEEAKKVTDKPSIIEVKTLIGFGSPNKQGKATAHGEPLGEEELKLTKKALGFNPEESFHVPSEVKKEQKEFAIKAQSLEDDWNILLENYEKSYPEDYKKWLVWNTEELPIDLLENEDFWKCEGDIATRISSEQILNKVCKLIPNLVGGSADLAPSTKTIMKDLPHYDKNTKNGSNLHFGIRELAMTAIANGMLVHGGLRLYVSGFFVFVDYMKPALRISSLMELPLISILTHDSIGVGEDGPTHQPVEQLASLRATPNMTVIRPCDTNETAAAWYLALTRTKSPTSLILSRQNLRLLKESGKAALKGGYILRDSNSPEIILIASGSEVSLVYDAYDVLKEKGINSRVVSMPCMEVFEEQTKEYKESVLPKNIQERLAVEAGQPQSWYKYVGLNGDVIGIDRFGASAPYDIMFKEYGFTVDNVVAKALKLLNK